MNKPTLGKWEIKKVSVKEWWITDGQQGIGIVRSNNPEFNAPLIVTAVNACIKINPKSPQAVADQIEAMYKALKEALAFLDKQREEYNSALSILPRKLVGRGILATKIEAVLNAIEKGE